MRILAFETSAKAVSVALVTDGLLTGEYYQNSGQTHSRTLMKLAEDLLRNCDLQPSDVDLVAWANGPGSFTGVRIGAAAAKGFCWGGELPAAAVSTLEAMAWHLGPTNGLICCCMDARREQVYNALFRWADSAPCRGGHRPPAAEDADCHTSDVGHWFATTKPERLCDDRAISIEDLAADLRRCDGPVTLVGDGAKLVYDTLHEAFPALILAPEHLRQQRASGVALAAWHQSCGDGHCPPAGDVNPNYLRLSQAERERLEKRIAAPVTSVTGSQ